MTATAPAGHNDAFAIAVVRSVRRRPSLPALLVHAALLSAGVSVSLSGALAQPVTQPAPIEPLPPGSFFPPGYVEEPANAPEDPLPPPPKEMPLVPAAPVVAAPDAVDVLKECKQAAFTDCFRLWQPPPPPPTPPEPEKDTASIPPPPPPAASSQAPADPKAPRDPAQDRPPPPPPPDPAKETAKQAAASADRATLDALTKALKESGLDGKVLLTNPAGGDPTLKLDSGAAKPAAKR